MGNTGTPGGTHLATRVRSLALWVIWLLLLVLILRVLLHTHASVLLQGCTTPGWLVYICQVGSHSTGKYLVTSLLAV